MTAIRSRQAPPSERRLFGPPEDRVDRAGNSGAFFSREIAQVEGRVPPPPLLFARTRASLARPIKNNHPKMKTGRNNWPAGWRLVENSRVTFAGTPDGEVAEPVCEQLGAAQAFEHRVWDSPGELGNLGGEQ